MLLLDFLRDEYRVIQCMHTESQAVNDIVHYLNVTVKETPPVCPLLH